MGKRERRERETDERRGRGCFRYDTFLGGRTLNQGRHPTLLLESRGGGPSALCRARACRFPLPSRCAESSLSKAHFSPRGNQMGSWIVPQLLPYPKPTLSSLLSKQQRFFGCLQFGCQLQPLRPDALGRTPKPGRAKRPRSAQLSPAVPPCPRLRGWPVFSVVG